jgi:hypothetical protein
MGLYTHINLHDPSSAIGSSPAPPTVKMNGNGNVTVTTVSGLSQLDARWGYLSENIKVRILTLAGAATN